jgi:hypothetical protein
MTDHDLHTVFDLPGIPGFPFRRIYDDPGAIVFDEQSTRRRSDSVAHFESREFSGVEIKELVGQIREHEDRLSDLRAKLE